MFQKQALHYKMADATYESFLLLRGMKTYADDGA